MDVPVIGRKAREARPIFHAFSSLWGLKPDRLLGDRKLAVDVVHRDLEELRVQVEFERTIDANAWTPVKAMK